jgi:hypothetical protein
MKILNQRLDKERTHSGFALDNRLNQGTLGLRPRHRLNTGFAKRVRRDVHKGLI